MKTISILSIDAWRDMGGWTWNNWFKTGTCDITVCDKTPRQLFRFLREEGYLSEGSKGKIALEDDQYNLVIVEKNTRKPIFALAYGEMQD